LKKEFSGGISGEKIVFSKFILTLTDLRAGRAKEFYLLKHLDLLGTTA